MANRPDNYFTMFVGDYLRDTMHLTTRQHGAYQLLLMHYYGTGRPLPFDDDTLRTIAREGPQEWKADGAVVMAFFTKASDGWHQKRADLEIAAANTRYERAMKGAAAKHGGKQSASKSQASNKQADKHVLNGCLNDANPNPPATQDGLTGQSCDSSARQAARRGKAAAPAALGDDVPGWEQSFPKWVAFREKVGPGAWTAWFLKARLNGSETNLLVDSEFAQDQVRFRYAKQLEEHFGERVSVRFDAVAYAGAT